MIQEQWCSHPAWPVPSEGPSTGRSGRLVWLSASFRPALPSKKLLKLMHSCRFTSDESTCSDKYEIRQKIPKVLYFWHQPEVGILFSAKSLNPLNRGGPEVERESNGWDKSCVRMRLINYQHRKKGWKEGYLTGTLFVAVYSVLCSGNVPK